MNCIRERESGYSVTARRNNSLSSAYRLAAFALVELAPFGGAITYAWQGAWPMLLFAGIELVALYLAFKYVERHARDYERLTISGDVVQIEMVEVGHVQRIQLSRWWAQVICRHDGACLALRSHGREIKFGRYLTDVQRRAVARALRKELGSR